MKGKTRYFLLFAITVLCSVYILSKCFENQYNSVTDEPPLLKEIIDIINFDHLKRLKQASRQIDARAGACTFAKCFNLGRCGKKRKVYVYPSNPELHQSIVYSNILLAIRESNYYTSNPDEACIFVLSFDTIDRDRTSRNYFANLQTYIDNLPRDLWNGGENHVIYNLYHGTWPNYSELDIGFDPGKAIMARASASEQNFRHGFDLSFPLFHPEHPFEIRAEANYSTSRSEELLVSFKGKRYVYGIGSDTRDSLYHLHDGKRIAMITTCKHNTDWQNYKDERCEGDNARYDGWDYQYLLANSTFCLTPRGRRLGSFRFLESLGAGCIPVILSDHWVLPFAEIIDWNSAAVRIAEKNVLLTTDILFSIPRRRIERMRRTARLLYDRYFASVEKITLASLEIIFSRVDRYQETKITEAAESLEDPIFKTDNQLTGIIFTGPRVSSKLQKLISQLDKIPGLKKILILWHEDRGTLPRGADFGTTIEKDFMLVKTGHWCISCIPKDKLPKTGSILFMDERLAHLPNETLSMISMYRRAPERLHCLHVFEYIERIASHHTGIPRVFRFAYPSMAIVNSAYLTRFPLDGTASECDWLRLSVATSYLSHTPPIPVGRGDTQPWMRLDVLNQCARQLSSHFPTGLRLPAADESFIF